jgi:MSHA biogenesis protein MshP
MLSSHSINRKKQQGASLIIVAFIIVVLGLLAAAMVNLLSAGSESVAREVLSTRALFAAESGAQAKLNQVFMGGDVECDDPLPSITGLDNCSVSIRSCDRIQIGGVNYYTIVSEGRCGAISDQSVRLIEVQAKDG